MASEKHKTNRKPRPQEWKPGQSGNPNGRPRSERALSNALRAVVDPVEFAEVLWRLARGLDEDGLHVAEPSLPALKLIAERLEGLAVASVNLDAHVSPRLAIVDELKRIADTEAANDA